MFDYHVHVWPHTPGTPTPSYDRLARYCERAHELGIEQIAITEHSHRFDRIQRDVLPHWRRPLQGDMAEATQHVLDVEGGADLDDYVAALVDAQSRGLPLLVGLEVDYLAGTADAMTEVLADYPFDVLLGSVHWLDEWLFDAYDNPVFESRWLERDTDDVFAEYVDSVLALAHSGMVDVLAHLDVITVAGYLPDRLDEHQDRLVAGLADADIAIEFSSAGLRKPAASTYPSPDLLDKLLLHGVALTTSSDAHIVDHIGHEYSHLRDQLNRRGVTQLATFKHRERTLVDRRH